MWQEPLRLKEGRGSLPLIEEKKNLEKNNSPPPPQRSGIWRGLTPGINLLFDKNLKEQQVVPTIFSCGCSVRVCTWMVCRCAHRCRRTQLTSVDRATPWALLVPDSPSQALAIRPLHRWWSSVFCGSWGSRFISLWLLCKHLTLWAVSPASPRLFLWLHIQHKQAKICANTCVQPLPCLLTIFWWECSAPWEPTRSN